MSKVQELMNLVQKQTQASAESPQNNNPLGDVSSDLAPKGKVHSNHNFIVNNVKNKKPIETGWMPGMMYVPHGGGSNQGF